jgi:hypothetical protein
MGEPIPEEYANYLLVYKLFLRCMLSLAWLQVDVYNLSVLGKFRLQLISNILVHFGIFPCIFS